MKHTHGNPQSSNMASLTHRHECHVTFFTSHCCQILRTNAALGHATVHLSKRHSVGLTPLGFERHLAMPSCIHHSRGHFPLFFPTFCVTHNQIPSLSLESKSFFIPDGLLRKSPTLHQCCGRILVGCGAPTFPGMVGCCSAMLGM